MEVGGGRDALDWIPSFESRDTKTSISVLLRILLGGLSQSLDIIKIFILCFQDIASIFMLFKNR